MLSRWFKKEKTPKIDFNKVDPLKVDMHSHLLPGIDDGAQSLEDSIELIQVFQQMGYQKLITTPHIMGDFYRNTPEIIREKLEIVKEELEKREIDIQIEAAAEYYLDESLMEKLNGDAELLTIGGKYLLFETSYMHRSSYLDEAVFLIRSRGLTPVLAHPERYVYLFGKFDRLKEIAEKEVLFQININSLTGYYSKDSKKVAEELLKENMVSFLGSDCHNVKHQNITREANQLPFYQLALTKGLLNNTLL